MQRRDTIFAAAAALVVLASATAGFWILGSPRRQRDMVWDSKRVADLRAIAGEIRAQWTRTDPPQALSLPESLNVLVSAPGAQPLSIEDPVSGQPYEYLRRHGPVYELCATFARGTDEYRKEADALPASFWDHPRGRRCFLLDAGRAVPR